MTVQQCQEPGTATVGVPLGRAARELELKPREFELAVQLGHVRTVVSGPGGRRRVPRDEIERHTAGSGFPDTLRTRVWVVGTAEGAELMGISPARFGRLARAGCFAPVRFYVNRYRAVVWHYLAADLVEFADAHPDLLTGRTPPALRTALAEREDRRARTWRARRIDQLLALTEDPWERAAVIASVLGPEQLADAVPDPYERAYVSTMRPELAHGRPNAVAGREVIDRVTLAEDPDEIERHRRRLTIALAEARAIREAPRPEGPRADETPTAPTRATTEPMVTTAGPLANGADVTPAGRQAKPSGLRALWRRLRWGSMEPAGD
ncbi:DUF6397 family protein [Streptomyces olivoreticuli]|uniref:DUF6397 family protein n=1 Tax=Streptomyces olivoreticuli TaxID=68246 RepID=UPI00265A0DF8|nr:DUF6397 family protein [Streptomyces olivoreticuli]WKK24666.1 DUF6397 family protein [Streptomyces olivoreticuli]